MTLLHVSGELGQLLLINYVLDHVDRYHGPYVTHTFHKIVALLTGTPLPANVGTNCWDPAKWHFSCGD